MTGWSSSLRSLHMLNHIITELRAFDLGRAFHQSCEIVGHTFTCDGTGQSFDDEVGDFSPAHVTKHHFTGKNDRTWIHFILVGIFGRGPVSRFEDGVSTDIIDVPAGSDPDASHLR